MPARRVDIDDHEIIRRYEAGEGSDAIGEALNISPNTVLNRLREFGVARRRSGPARKYDDATICRMYKSGDNIADILKKTGATTTATFYAILRRNGVPVRLQRHNRECPLMQHRIHKLRKKGLSQFAIAKIVGINRNYVRDILYSSKKNQCVYHYKRDRYGVVTEVYRDYDI